MPPGVFASSVVGVNGGAADFERLLRWPPERARRLLTLPSVLRTGGVERGVESNVGVGGVTKVSGVCCLLDGVSGSFVMRRRASGVSGRAGVSGVAASTRDDGARSCCVCESPTSFCDAESCTVCSAGRVLTDGGAAEAGWFLGRKVAEPFGSTMVGTTDVSSCTDGVVSCAVMSFVSVRVFTAGEESVRKP